MENVIEYFSKAGVTDINSISLMILDRHIYGPNRDDVCHTGNTTEDVINAFPVWLDWRESTLQDIKDTCNLLNVQYERVFNVICKRFNLLAGDRYTVDEEDVVCMHWYSFKENVLCLTRDNHYIDKSGKIINNFQKAKLYLLYNSTAEIYESMPDVYKVCASKEEAVVIYLDVIRRFIDFHEKDCRELAGRSYLRALE